MNHCISHRPLGTGSVLPAVTAILVRVTDLFVEKKTLVERKEISVTSVLSTMTCKSVKTKWKLWISRNKINGLRIFIISRLQFCIWKLSSSEVA